MNISLTPEMDQWVADLVKSGAYKSSSEVIREGLRTLRRLEEQRRAMVEDLRQELFIGVKQLDAGKSAAFEPGLLAELKKKAAADLAYEGTFTLPCEQENHRSRESSQRRQGC